MKKLRAAGSTAEIQKIRTSKVLQNLIMEGAHTHTPKAGHILAGVLYCACSVTRQIWLGCTQMSLEQPACMAMASGLLSADHLSRESNCRTLLTNPKSLSAKHCRCLGRAQPSMTRISVFATYAPGRLCLGYCGKYCKGLRHGQKQGHV